MERIDGALWRKSTFSGNGGNCVEVATDATRVLVRDTKDRQRTVLEFGAEPWKRFVAFAKAGGL
jgi:hypothetical protein